MTGTLQCGFCFNENVSDELFVIEIISCNSRIAQISETGDKMEKIRQSFGYLKAELTTSGTFLRDV